MSGRPALASGARPLALRALVRVRKGQTGPVFARRAAAALLGALLATAPAAAEPVRVLSGEHADFSRIVLIFDSDVGWTSARSAEGFRIRFDKGGLEPDLSRVFELIPRDRIVDLRYYPQDEALVIESGCDCHLDVFEAGRNTLALDVKDGPPPGGSERTEVPEPVRSTGALPRLPLVLLSRETAPLPFSLPTRARASETDRP